MRSCSCGVGPPAPGPHLLRGLCCLPACPPARLCVTPTRQAKDTVRVMDSFIAYMSRPGSQQDTWDRGVGCAPPVKTGTTGRHPGCHNAMEKRQGPPEALEGREKRRGGSPFERHASSRYQSSSRYHSGIQGGRNGGDVRWPQWCPSQARGNCWLGGSQRREEEI